MRFLAHLLTDALSAHLLTDALSAHLLTDALFSASSDRCAF